MTDKSMKKENEKKRKRENIPTRTRDAAEQELNALGHRSLNTAVEALFAHASTVQLQSLNIASHVHPEKSATAKKNAKRREKAKALRLASMPRKPWPLFALTRITVTEMRLEHVHQDRLLEVQVVRAAVRAVGVMFLGQDTTGTMVRVVVYNLPSDVEEPFPLNSVWVVRDPWFKLGSEDRSPMIRIDDSDDIKRLSDYHCQVDEKAVCPPHAAAAISQSLKDQGAAAFAAHQFQRALDLYREAIECAPEEDQELRGQLYANCSLMHATLGNFSDALKDAQEALMHAPTWWRGHLRLVQAHLGLGGLEAAAASFHQLYMLRSEVMLDLHMMRLARKTGWFRSPQLLAFVGLQACEEIWIIHSDPTVGDYPFLSDAISQSRYKSFLCGLLVLPGCYTGQVSLERGQRVYITGMPGHTQDTTVRVTEKTLHTLQVMGQSTLRLCHLTLLQAATFSLTEAEANLYHTVFVSGTARVSIHQCSISHPGGAAVSVRERAEATLSDTDISNVYCAVLMIEDAQVQCARLRVTDARFSGIEARDQASLHLQSCAITRTGKHGISVAMRATALLEDCMVSQTGSLGASRANFSALNLTGLDMASRLEARRCQIVDNFSTGVFARSGTLCMSETTVARSCLGNARYGSVYLMVGVTASFVECVLERPANLQLADSECKECKDVLPIFTVHIHRNGNAAVVFRRCMIEGQIAVEESARPLVADATSPVEICDTFSSFPNQKDKQIRRGNREGRTNEAKNGRICGACTLAEYVLPDRKFLSCGNCKLVYYCSTECQKMAWKSHKLECRPPS